MVASNHSGYGIAWQSPSSRAGLRGGTIHLYTLLTGRHHECPGHLCLLPRCGGLSGP